MERLDHAEPWMIETAREMVAVVKNANYMGSLAFHGNGRTVEVTRRTDGIFVTFDYMGEETRR